MSETLKPARQVYIPPSVISAVIAAITGIKPCREKLTPFRHRQALKVTLSNHFHWPIRGRESLPWPMGRMFSNQSQLTSSNQRNIYCSTDNLLNGPNPRNETSQSEHRHAANFPAARKSLKQTQIRVAQPINLCMREQSLACVCNQKVTPDSHLSVSTSLCPIFMSPLQRLLKWASSDNIGTIRCHGGRLPRYERDDWITSYQQVWGSGALLCVNHDE